jgi:glyceraldehyde-3-phosphate dehydrogenase (NAD(P))
MKVLVNGLGNIGTTLLGLLSDYKELLGIDTIYALKNSEVHDWNREGLSILAERGVIICSKSGGIYRSLEDIIQEVDYIFDCNANSIGLKNKPWYSSLPKLRGSSAQGSEKGFGIPFMSDINNHQVLNERFVHVVSCNTHGIAAIILTMVNNDFSNFIEGDFVVVRRSEDIGNHQRLVSGNVLSRHLDNIAGTHHAIDVKDLFRTRNIELQVQSSDVTTPSQLMHVVRYSISLKSETDISQIRRNALENWNVSVSKKFDSNVIFELGRRYSPYGRIYSHAVLNDNNIIFDKANTVVKGWAFIPQEGNTLLSTIHAYILQTGLPEGDQVFHKIRRGIVRKEW